MAEGQSQKQTSGVQARALAESAAGEFSNSGTNCPLIPRSEENPTHSGCGEGPVNTVAASLQLQHSNACLDPLSIQNPSLSRVVFTSLCINLMQLCRAIGQGQEKWCGRVFTCSFRDYPRSWKVTGEGGLGQGQGRQDASLVAIRRKGIYFAKDYKMGSCHAQMCGWGLPDCQGNNKKARPQTRTEQGRPSPLGPTCPLVNRRTLGGSSPRSARSYGVLQDSGPHHS